MIVAALQRDTGRAVRFGVPRNLVEVPLPVRRARPRFPDLLNALYQFGTRAPRALPGRRDPGATALKQTISRLLGIRIDYYAIVDLRGFVHMVDALGGVRIRVKERLVDEVTRPAWGETKPKIDVQPGPHVPLHRPDGARLRALAEGVERLPPHGAAALLPERPRRPARRRLGAAPLRLARRGGRGERPH